MITPATTTDSILRRMRPLFVAVLTLAVLGGCDAGPTQTSNSESTSSDSDEVIVRNETFAEANLQFEPVALQPGETFSIELMDDELGRNATRITHEGTSDGKYHVRAQFDPLQPSSVTVQCRNQNEGVQRKMNTLTGAELSAKDAVMATSDPEPSSYHYYDNGETVIVAVDYGGQNPGGRFQFPSSDRSVECTHVDFVLNGVSTDLSADGVRFRGGTKPPAFRMQQFK